MSLKGRRECWFRFLIQLRIPRSITARGMPGKISRGQSWENISEPLRIQERLARHWADREYQTLNIERITLNIEVKRGTPPILLLGGRWEYGETGCNRCVPIPKLGA